MMDNSHQLPHVGEHVRLKTDVPDLGLQAGETGSVCGTWFFAPENAFEVEFSVPGLAYPIRALLVENQIEADGMTRSDA